MRLAESPSERLRTVTLGLAADATLSHVLLGAFLTSTIQFAVGMVPWVLPTISGGLWLCSVVLYAVADEFKQRIEEKKQQVLDPASSYKGIE